MNMSSMICCLKSTFISSFLFFSSSHISPILVSSFFANVNNSIVNIPSPYLITSNIHVNSCTTCLLYCVNTFFSSPNPYTLTAPQLTPFFVLCNTISPAHSSIRFAWTHLQPEAKASHAAYSADAKDSLFHEEGIAGQVASLGEDFLDCLWNPPPAVNLVGTCSIQLLSKTDSQASLKWQLRVRTNVSRDPVK